MEIKIPEVGESIHEALIAEWVKQDGDTVNKDDLLCELETDKINVELTAEAAGVLKISVAAGETVAIGTVIGEIDESAASTAKKEPAAAEKAAPKTEPEKAAAPKPAAPASPAAAKIAREKGVDLSQVSGSGRGGRPTIEDVQAIKNAPEPPPPKPRKEEPKTVTAKGAETEAAEPTATRRPTTREPMSPIRQRIAARLLEARQQTAMLTTFNEADMSQVKAVRAKHQEHFTNKHGIKLGMMSFFVKATIEALKEYPAVNASIDGQDIVYHHFYDIGIAVGTERGLVVPILRSADQLTFAEIEQKIAELAKKANDRKLTLAELEGGTFTISNGGVYGSVLSTPILNPPQTGVLGMHAIMDRAVVIDGEIEIRPIMNLALSYDHRLIDGREAVGFLKLIKDYIEDPEGLLLEL